MLTGHVAVFCKIKLLIYLVLIIIRIISSHIDTVYKISNVGQFVQPYKQAKQTLCSLSL